MYELTKFQIDLLKIGKSIIFGFENMFYQNFVIFSQILDGHLPIFGKILKNFDAFVNCRSFPKFGKFSTIGYPKT